VAVEEVETMGEESVMFDELPLKDQQIVWHANDMLWLWRDLSNQKPGDSWFEQKARQAYHDCLLSLKHVGLIEDYDCVRVQTKVGGVWYSDRRQLSFEQTGSIVDVI
jgi:hypothetical protein